MIKIVITIGLLFSANLFADSYADGYQKYKQGNNQQAIAIFKQACADGDMKCCFAEGKMYATGKGVKIDLEKAKELYSKSCDGGDTIGCQHYEALNKK